MSRTGSRCRCSATCCRSATGTRSPSPRSVTTPTGCATRWSPPRRTPASSRSPRRPGKGGAGSTALPLAASFAQVDHDAILVLLDPDSTLPNALGLSAEAGLSDVLNGTADLIEVLDPVPSLPRLQVLPLGAEPAAISRMLASDRGRPAVRRAPRPRRVHHLRVGRPDQDGPGPVPAPAVGHRPAGRRARAHGEPSPGGGRPPRSTGWVDGSRVSSWLRRSSRPGCRRCWPPRRRARSPGSKSSPRRAVVARTGPRSRHRPRRPHSRSAAPAAPGASGRSGAR